MNVFFSGDSALHSSISSSLSVNKRRHWFVTKISKDIFCCIRACEELHEQNLTTPPCLFTAPGWFIKGSCADFTHQSLFTTSIRRIIVICYQAWTRKKDGVSGFAALISILSSIVMLRRRCNAKFIEMLNMQRHHFFTLYLILGQDYVLILFKLGKKYKRQIKKQDLHGHQWENTDILQNKVNFLWGGEVAFDDLKK